MTEHLCPLRDIVKMRFQVCRVCYSQLRQNYIRLARFSQMRQHNANFLVFCAWWRRPWLCRLASARSAGVCALRGHCLRRRSTHALRSFFGAQASRPTARSSPPLRRVCTIRGCLGCLRPSLGCRLSSLAWAAASHRTSAGGSVTPKSFRARSVPRRCSAPSRHVHP